MASQICSRHNDFEPVMSGIWLLMSETWPASTGHVTDIGHVPGLTSCREMSTKGFQHQIRKIKFIQEIMCLPIMPSKEYLNLNFPHRISHYLRQSRSRNRILDHQLFCRYFSVSNYLHYYHPQKQNDKNEIFCPKSREVCE